MSKAWAKGSTPAWRKTRAGVLLRNQQEHGGRCQLRIRRVCTGQADTVHHIVGRAVSGDDPKYLVACCRACNLSVGEPGRDRAKPKRVSSW